MQLPGSWPGSPHVIAQTCQQTLYLQGAGGPAWAAGAATPRLAPTRLAAIKNRLTLFKWTLPLLSSSDKDCFPRRLICSFTHLS